MEMALNLVCPGKLFALKAIRQRLTCSAGSVMMPATFTGRGYGAHGRV